jgi:hypothetical protein
MTPPLRTDVHQHLWPAELLDALAAGSDPPFARRDGDSWLLHVPAEPPSPIVAQEPGAPAASLAGQGVDRALLSLSTALEVERLAPNEAAPLLAWGGVAAALPEALGAWASLNLAGATPHDVDALLDEGFVVHGSDIPVLHTGAPSDDARVRENPARLLG